MHLSIEFTGGSLIEVQYAQSADLNKTRAAVESLGLGEVQVQNFGTSRDVLIRLPLRGNMKQTELVSKVFGALCQAGTRAGSDQRESDKGPAQVCVAANNASP